MGDAVKMKDSVLTARYMFKRRCRLGTNAKLSSSLSGWHTFKNGSQTITYRSPVRWRSPGVTGSLWADKRMHGDENVVFKV
jgi:hypothetical protein